MRDQFGAIFALVAAVIATLFAWTRWRDQDRKERLAMRYREAALNEIENQAPWIVKWGLLGLLSVAGITGGAMAVKRMVPDVGPANVYGSGTRRIPLPGGTTGSYDAPNAPTFVSINPPDTSTVIVTVSAFSGDQDDTYDSLRIVLDTTGGDFLTPLIDSISGPQTVDTLSSNTNLTEGGVYDIIAYQKGNNGGWSVASAVYTYTNGTDPALVTDLRVTFLGDTSAVAEWSATSDGIGGIARASLRWNDTAAVNHTWWIYDGEKLDSSALAVGDTVTYTIPGLTASTLYSIAIKSYRGFPGIDSYYNPGTSNIVEFTTLDPVGGVVAPSVPTLTLTATSDTSQMVMTGTPYDGQNQSHDSTRFILSANSDLSSPFKDTVTVGQTSLTVTDNGNLTGGNTYYGGLLYKASITGWTDTSAIASAVNTVPGNHPNLPGYMTLLGENDMCDLNANGWSEYDPGNHLSVITSPTNNPAPPASPECVARWTVFSGETAGSGNQQLTLPVVNNGYEELYVHYYMWVDSNWDGWLNCTNKFVWMTTQPGGGTNDFWNICFSGGQNPQLRYTLQPPWEFAQSYIPATTVQTWSRDTWADLELYVKAETFSSGVSQDDGVIKAWVNGVQVYNETGVDHMLGTESGVAIPDPPYLNRFSFYAIWGGSTTVASQNMWMEVDHAWVYGYNAP